MSRALAADRGPQARPYVGTVSNTKTRTVLCKRGGPLLCFSQELDVGASASVAKSLFHWLRGPFMMLKRMLRIQVL